jgi:hypothetical protein
MILCGNSSCLFLFCREMWEQSMEGMMKNLILKTTNPPIYTYIAERNGNQLIHKVICWVLYACCEVDALSLCR